MEECAFPRPARGLIYSGARARVVRTRDDELVHAPRRRWAGRGRAGTGPEWDGQAGARGCAWLTGRVRRHE